MLFLRADGRSWDDVIVGTAGRTALGRVTDTAPHRACSVAAHDRWCARLTGGVPAVELALVVSDLAGQKVVLDHLKHPHAFVKWESFTRGVFN